MNQSLDNAGAPPVIFISRKHSPFWTWLTILISLGAAAILFWFNPSTHGFYPRCGLYTATGLYCPGCGSLRALHWLSHGRVLTALHYNPLLVLGLPFAIIYGVRLLIYSAGRKPAPKWKWSPTLVKVCLAATVLFTILRNIPYAPFNLLAPPG